MNRRALLRSVPIAVAVGAAGCSGRLRPEVRTESGMGLIHPASEQHLDGGLQPGGSDQQFATAIRDEAPEWVGSDADESLADRLTSDYETGDAFHLIVQLRSSPETPRRLWPITGTSLRWASWSTLQIVVTNEPWEIYDEAERERLQAADELIFTSLWTVTPILDELPDTVRITQ